MITVATHKRHKSPMKHSKSIYVFTSGPVIVTVQIHSKKRGLNDRCKIAINTGAQQDSRYPGARFNEKGCLQACGGDALTIYINFFYFFCIFMLECQ
jgi:hypothetical protein